MHLYKYGTLEPVVFKLQLIGVGQNSITLADNDVHLFIDEVLYGVDLGEIGTECTYIVGSNGLYKWQPVLPAQTTGKKLVLDIKDADSGGLFEENAIELYSGGHENAYFGIVP